MNTEFDQMEIVLVSDDMVKWRPAFYCFPQDDGHRVAFVKMVGRIACLKWFKYVKKVKE